MRLTYADYAQLPEGGPRLELLAGEPMMSQSASARHQELFTRLLLILATFVRERGLGSVFTSPLDVILSDDPVVQPDLLFISARREKALVGTCVHGAPDPVVEIVSPQQRCP